VFNALPAATSSVRTWLVTGTFEAWPDPGVLDVEVLDVLEPPDAEGLLGAVDDVVVVDGVEELEHAAKERAPTKATMPANHDRRCM
jgi:hypothetical protein